MKNVTKWLATAFGITALAVWVVPNAQAACGGYAGPVAKKSGVTLGYSQPQLLRAALSEERDRDDGVSIVGFWHVKFISDGNSYGLPSYVPTAKGDTFDAGYSQWHSDGTEIMNSGGRPPNTGSFCLGVWERTGIRQYKLNHFAMAWDPTQGPNDAAGNPVGVLIGPANIKESVTLSPDGKSFAGVFTLEGYDESGDHIYHVEGAIYGTRITVDTPISPVF